MREYREIVERIPAYLMKAATEAAYEHREPKAVYSEEDIAKNRKDSGHDNKK